MQKTFAQTQVRSAISAKDTKLSEIYQDLYERTIDWGAHPNEKALTASLVRSSFNPGSKQIEFKMLGESGIALDHALRTAAQVGVCVLKVFVHTIGAFSSNEIRSRVNDLSRGL